MGAPTEVSVKETALLVIDGLGARVKFAVNPVAMGYHMNTTPVPPIAGVPV